jgi:serine/threonine protein kinase
MNLYIKKQSKIHDLPNVNVVKSIHVVNENQIGTMSEMCDGNVNELLLNQELSEKEKLTIIMQMAKGVEQLHRIHVVHRDIKVDNFLYKKDVPGRIRIKIADFGMSSRIKKK